MVSLGAREDVQGKATIQVGGEGEKRNRKLNIPVLWVGSGLDILHTSLLRHGDLILIDHEAIRELQSKGRVIHVYAEEGMVAHKSLQGNLTVRVVPQVLTGKEKDAN